MSPDTTCWLMADGQVGKKCYDHKESVMTEKLNTAIQIPVSMTRAWMIVGLLFVIAVLHYIDRTMITTMRGSIVEAIPMTDAQFGLLTAVFLWIYGLLSPVAGFMADRLGKSKVILGS